jgi:hypothetical protein
MEIEEAAELIRAVEAVLASNTLSPEGAKETRDWLRIMRAGYHCLLENRPISDELIERLIRSRPAAESARSSVAVTSSAPMVAHSFQATM